MIEFIVLGVVLFIVGVGATIVYDKHKEYKASRPVPPPPQPKPAATYRPRRGTLRASTPAKPKKSAELDLEELLKKIEKMKNEL